MENGVSVKKINKCGRYQRISDDNIINSFVEGELLLPEKWKNPIDEVINEFLHIVHSQFIHSIYITGNLAENIYYDDGISDLDFRIITLPSIEDWKQDVDPMIGIGSMIYDFKDKILSKYDYIRDITQHTTFFPFLNSQDIFSLKIHCRCVYGTDIIPSLPEIHMKDVYSSFATDIFSVPLVDKEYVIEWINLSIGTLESFIYNDGTFDESMIDRPKESYYKHLNRWSFRHLLRLFFCDVMEKEMIYTRDLYPCYHFLSKNYPDMKDILYDCLKIAVYGDDDMEKSIKLMKKFKGFMSE